MKITFKNKTRIEYGIEIGDEVYYLKDNAVHRDIVTGLIINLERDHTKSCSYLLLGEEYGGFERLKIPRNQCFTTEDKLFKSISFDEKEKLYEDFNNIFGESSVESEK